MKFSEAVLEFLIPGIVFLFPVLIIYIFLSKAHPDLNLFTSFKNVEIIIGVFYLCISYIIGIVLSEIGTKIVFNKSNKAVNKMFIKYKDLLKMTNYESIRKIDLDNIHNLKLWNEFSYIRAYCRTHSEKASDRVKSHENILRILRPSMISLPFCLLLMGMIILSKSDSFWNTISICSYIFTLSSVGLFFLLQNAYLQRLETATKSAIQHYIAINNLESDI